MIVCGTVVTLPIIKVPAFILPLPPLKLSASSPLMLCWHHHGSCGLGLLFHAVP